MPTRPVTLALDTPGATWGVTVGDAGHYRRRMDSLNEWLGNLEGILWDYMGTWVIVALALWFTFYTGAVQARMVPEMFRAITEKTQRDETGEPTSLSAFQAFIIAAAARVGTGNVAGVAGAIFLGGPGAVVWMWIMAFFTSAASFIESTLGQLYKTRGDDTYKGGPAFYIHRGLGSRGFGVFFAILFIFCFALSFTSLQANTIVDAVTGAVAPYSDPEAMPWLSWVLGLVLATMTAVIVLGGMWRVARVAQNLVPVMATIYLVVGVIVVLMNADQIPRVLEQMFSGAFNPQAVVGGGVGAAIVQGVQRGMFSNEAGMGSVPNVAATASVSHPVKQGLFQTLGVYFDTWLICSVTAFIVLIGFPDVSEGGEGLVMVQDSLVNTLGTWAVVLLAVIVFLLAFTSVLGNFSYGEANINFITRSRRARTVFGLAVTAVVFIGSVLSVDLAWTVAGLTMVVIAMVNMVVITLLAPKAVKLLRHYNEQRRQGLDPVFLASEMPELDGVECWTEADVRDCLARREQDATR